MSSPARLSVEVSHRDSEDTYQLATSHSPSLTQSPPTLTDSISSVFSTVQLDQAHGRLSMIKEHQAVPHIITAKPNNVERDNDVSHLPQVMLRENGPESKSNSGHSNDSQVLEEHVTVKKLLYVTIALTILNILSMWKGPKVEKVINGNMIYNNYHVVNICKEVDQWLPNWPCPPRKNEASANKSKFRESVSQGTISYQNCQICPTPQLQLTKGVLTCLVLLKKMKPLLKIPNPGLKELYQKWPDLSNSTVLLDTPDTPQRQKDTNKSAGSREKRPFTVRMSSSLAGMEKYTKEEINTCPKDSSLNKDQSLVTSSEGQSVWYNLPLDKDYFQWMNTLSLSLSQTRTVHNTKTANIRKSSAVPMVLIQLNLRYKVQRHFKSQVVQALSPSQLKRQHQEICEQQQAKDLIKSFMTQDFTSLSMQGDSACKPSMKSVNGAGLINVDLGLGMLEGPVCSLIQISAHFATVFFTIISFIAFVPCQWYSLKGIVSLSASMKEKLKDKVMTFLFDLRPGKLGLIIHCMMYCWGGQIDVAENTDSGVPDSGSFRCLSADEQKDLKERLQRRELISKRNKSPEEGYEPQDERKILPKLDPDNTTPAHEDSTDFHEVDDRDNDHDSSIPWPLNNTQDFDKPSIISVPMSVISSKQNIRIDENLTDIEPKDTWEEFEKDSLDDSRNPYLCNGLVPRNGDNPATGQLGYQDGLILETANSENLNIVGFKVTTSAAATSYGGNDNRYDTGDKLEIQPYKPDELKTTEPKNTTDIHEDSNTFKSSSSDEQTSTPQGNIDDSTSESEGTANTVQVSDDVASTGLLYPVAVVDHNPAPNSEDSNEGSNPQGGLEAGFGTETGVDTGSCPDTSTGLPGNVGTGSDEEADPVLSGPEIDSVAGAEVYLADDVVEMHGTGSGASPEEIDASVINLHGVNTSTTNGGNPVCQENACVPVSANLWPLLEAVKERGDLYEWLNLEPLQQEFSSEHLTDPQPRRMYNWNHRGFVHGRIPDMMNFLLGIVSAPNHSGVFLQSFSYPGGVVRVLSECRRLLVDERRETTYIEHQVELYDFLRRRREYEIYISHQDESFGSLKIYGVTKSIKQNGWQYVNLIYQARAIIEFITVFVVYKPTGPEGTEGRAFRIRKGLSVKSVLTYPPIHAMVMFLIEKYQALRPDHCTRLIVLGCQALASPTWKLNHTCILELIPTLNQGR